MEQNSVIQLNNSESYSGKVALPYNKEQFQNFIIGLLGKPQVIEKTIRGSYEIDMQFISGLVELIEQRIHQQNDSKLIEFRATIVYNDSSSVSLSGFEHFVNYSEPQPLVCKALHVTLQYLIKFKDKDVAEKQEITISFYTQGDYSAEYWQPTKINFRIAHTARTFGADIDGLLTKHLKTVVKESNLLRHIHNLDDSTVEKALTFLLFTISILCSYIWIDYTKVSSLIYLFVGTYALSCVVGVIINFVTPDERPSFILINKESYSNKTKALKAHKKEWLKFWLSTIGSLLLGLIGNYIYAFLNEGK